MHDKYEYVIWLEIHIKLNSVNKLFCRCKNEQEFDNLQPNIHICPTCTWQPWALPVLNQEPLEKAIILGYALWCKVSEYSRFDRKSYFYPDLPCGFQITQFESPTNVNGVVNFYINDYQDLTTIRIERAHIETDAWKTIHDGGKWIVDLNRAGTPLVEIVTFPDFKSDEEVVEFLKELQRIARYNDIWNADLEKWQMRVDVNISVREKGSDKLWTRVEIKNMNSFGAIRRAITHEFDRQVELLENKWVIYQETRWWDDAFKSSYTMRSKEDSNDYRYFPEPDLPILKLEQAYLDTLKIKVAQSLSEKIKIYKEEYWFNKEYINALIQSVEVNSLFHKTIELWFDAKMSAKWIVGYVLRFMNDHGVWLSELKFTKDQFIAFLELIKSWKLQDAQAKMVLMEMIENWKDAVKIIEDRWFTPVDSSEIEWIVKSTLDDNPNAVADLKAWKMNAIWFLVWQVMKKSWGKADPKVVKEIIEKLI